jgi:hypothetical protein
MRRQAVADWIVISRSEFERLLQLYVDAYGQAVYAQVDSLRERYEAIERANEAKRALERAVFP